MMSYAQRPQSFSVSSVETVAEQTDRLSINNEKGDFSVLSKMAPANLEGKTKLPVVSNIYKINVTPRIVHRYEIHMNASYPSGMTNEKILKKEISKGPRDDGSKIARVETCIIAMKLALETYGFLRESEAAIYDGAHLFYSNVSLDEQLKEINGTLVLNIEDLPEEIRKNLPKQSKELTIEISKNRDITSEINIADYNAARIQNKSLSNIDNSSRQLLDILTTTPFQLSDKWIAYGSGMLFPKDGGRRDVLVSDKGQTRQSGQERINGISKGIAFVELKNKGMHPGLVINLKTGQFFKEQSLLEAAHHFMNWVPGDDHCPFPFDTFEASVLNDYIKGLRLTRIDTDWSAEAFGLTDEPIEDIILEVDGKRVPVLSQFPSSIWPYNKWPAVKFKYQFKDNGKNKSKVIFVPIDLLRIVKGQRVPIKKQLGDPPRPDGPKERFQSIQNIRNGFMEEAEFSVFLLQFGVSIDKNPMKTDAFQRAFPKVIAGNEKSVLVKPMTNFDLRNFSFVQPAKLTEIVLAYNCKEETVSKLERLKQELEKKRIKATWHLFDVYKVAGKRASDEQRVRLSFEQAKAFTGQGKLVLLIYLDERYTDSHGYLKYYERAFLITSQHITVKSADNINKTWMNIIAKINTKLGGVNYHVVPESFAQLEWISNGKTLIIGYDVNHPTGPSTLDDQTKGVSTVGYSFNGAADPEYFIGRFHYQQPLREQVADYVLKTIITESVTSFLNQRKHLPENIVILRDGVSDGQFNMVLNEEYLAIKHGLSDFIDEKGLKQWNPKFVLTIVTKRHDKKFFMVSDEKKPEATNPPPGTVVDREIVRPDLTQFYLQSHQCIIGTAKLPCYYVLINDLRKDDNETLDKLQAFFLALSFEHQISPGAISLPEPIYQADAWATRGKTLWDTHLKLGHEIPRKKSYNKNVYKFGPPFDYTEMTKMMSFKGTSLELHRVNA